MGSSSPTAMQLSPVPCHSCSGVSGTGSTWTGSWPRHHAEASASPWACSWSWQGAWALSRASSRLLDGSEIVYVSLRDPAGGPPVAAVRLPPGPFPMPFEVTSANVIVMGAARPVPGTLDLSVRIDTDGNPMTRTDAEPSFMAKAVTKGTSGIDADLH